MIEQLKIFLWPGNVRELANVIQQMMVFCTGNRITLNDLPPNLFIREGHAPKSGEGKIQLMKMVSDLEKKWIVSKLKETDWNQKRRQSFSE